MNRSGKPVLLAGALLLTACGDRASSGPSGDPTPTVAAFLARSADAWNRRDLDGFVADYADEATTTFVSEGRAQHGFEWIRRNYAPTFAPGAPHDSLRFEDVEARWLERAHLLATARYVLFSGDSVTSSGPFTLVLRRTGAWKIIHDHTSRD